ncbi:hypothetical protein EDC01DRAFT_727914 [Geopyxis carbonaria]|nr:hypothetical protein EDC01DRAFT_727914 [Geopyxis carbonaria]
MSSRQESRREEFLKEHWDGDRNHFQLSYGLRFGDDDMEEGNAILDGLIKVDHDSRSEQARSATASSTASGQQQQQQHGAGGAWPLMMKYSGIRIRTAGLT